MWKFGRSNEVPSETKSAGPNPELQAKLDRIQTDTEAQVADGPIESVGSSESPEEALSRIREEDALEEIRSDIEHLQGVKARLQEDIDTIVGWNDITTQDRELIEAKNQKIAEIDAEIREAQQRGIDSTSEIVA